MSIWNKNFHQKMIAMTLSGAITISLFTPVAAMAAPAENAASGGVIDSSWTMYLVPNAHIDTAWQWPFEETARDVIKNTFSRAVSALKSNPNYKFTMSASKHYEWAKEYYPEMYEDIKELIKNGQWDNPGGQVVEPDLNIPSGEALVRQSLEAQRFFQKEFGQMSTVGYVPDTFGFNGQFPQILKKSGMNSFVTTKLNWQDTNVKRDSDIFKWKALDGSQVLAYAPMKDYVNIYSNSDIVGALNRNAQINHDTGVKEGLGLMGEGDHGGGPNESQYSAVLAQSGTSGVSGAQVKLATISEYFNDVSEKEKTNIEGDNVRTVDGEMYFENHRGTYTSWAKVKEYNRKNEVLAEKAEKAAALGNWLGVLPDAGSSEVGKAWDKILVNQFHDILPGSSIPYQYQVTYNNQELAKNLLNNVQSNGLQAIAYRANTKTNVQGIPVMVFNPLSWERDDTAEVSLDFNGGIPGKLAVYDVAANEKVASSVVTKDSGTQKATVSFEAKGLPPMGFRVFDVRAEDGTVANSLTVQKTSDTFTLENESLKVDINAETGNIAQIYNKKDNDRKVFADGYEGNELQILKDTGGTDYPAWNVIKSEMNANPIAVLNSKPEAVEIVQDTPEKKVVRVSRAWSDSTFTQDIILCADSDRVDVKMNVNWNENNRMLKIAFPFAADSDKATYEIAYGSVERPTTRDNSISAAQFEVSGHKWADITDNSKDFGTSILNDSKYGWDALKINDGGNPATRLRLTALRSPIGSTVRTPTSWAPQAYNIDKTEHNFTYSIYPHADTWQDADSVHKGDELNYRAEAIQVDQHDSKGLGASGSFASSSTDNVIISAIKSPEDEPDAKNQMIVRVYEAEGKDNTSATITLPSKVKSAKEVNMLEYDDNSLNKKISINGNKMTFNMDKYEITTIAVELDPYDNGDANISLKDSQADLFDYYNIDAVSFDDQKNDGNYDGKGDTIPAELWPDTVTYQGVDFDLGPSKNHYKNMVQANGQKIALPQGNYKYVYILGAGTGSGSKSGTFTVNQSGNTKVAQELKFADWDTNLSGWDRFSNTDMYPYVKDQVGHFFTHFHNGSTDRMTVDNYLFVYAIPVDPGKTLDSIELPKAGGMKIAAISAADSDYLRTMRLTAGSEETLPAITGVHAEIVTGDSALGDQARVSWNLTDGISAYRIYRGTAEDFTLGNATFVGSVSGAKNSYVDTLPYAGEFVYKVIGVDASSNKTKLSGASDIVKGGLDNAFLTVPKNNITAPGGYSGEEPYRACDGNAGTKWCYRQDGVYLQVDLGTDNGWNISKLTLINAGAAENSSYITRDFRIETSNDGQTWTTVVDRTNNTDNIVNIILPEPISARYFKLTPYYAGQTSNDRNCPRIYEFQAWGTSSRTLIPSAQNLTIDAVADQADSSKVTFTGGYEYVHSSMTGTEGKTTVQWYRSSDGENYEKIPDAAKNTLTMGASEALGMAAIKFTVTPVDKNDVSGEPVEKVFVLNDPSKDIFKGAPVVASHQFKDAEGGPMLTDGNLLTKWCADGVYPNDPRYAVIDTKGIRDLSKIVIWHATAPLDQKIEGANTADSNPAWNTRDYKIYISDDKKHWKEITSVTDNSSSITTHTYGAGTAVGRYIKLEVTKGVAFENGTPADGNSCVRIYEVLGYGKLLKFAENTQNEEVSNVVPKNVAILNNTKDRLPVAGDELKVKFDVDEKYVDLARFRWQVSDSKGGAFTAIDDSYADTFTANSQYLGKWIRANVRIDQGTTVSSEPIQILKTTDSFWNIRIASYDSADVTVSVNKPAAAAGDKIVVTATPSDQSTKAKVIVTDPEEKNIEVTAEGKDTFTFVMPDNSVKITVCITKPGEISAFEELVPDVKTQKVAIGTPFSSLNLPKVLKAIVDGISGVFASVSKWISSIAYNPMKTGEYDFTPVLDSGYVVDSGVSLPKIRVQVMPAEAADKTISSFDPLAASVTTQRVENGTPLASLNLPGSLKAKADGKAEDISGITWSSNPTYNSAASGIYTFKAVLPDGYVLGKGITVPVITVIVSKKDSDHSNHSGNGSSSEPSNSGGTSPSTITTATNGKGGTTATVTTKPDAAPVITGSHAAIIATVPSGITSVLSSATAEKPAEVKIAAPVPEILNLLSGSTVKTVDLTIRVPGAAVNNANANARISINLDPSILQAAKDAQKDITLAVTNADTGKIAYSWTFSGSDLKNSVTSVADINLAFNVIPVTDDAIASSVVAGNTIGKKPAGIILRFGSNGLLPGIAKVKVYVGDREGCTPNSKIYLYSLNAAAKVLEQMPQSEYTVDADGYVTVTIARCSDYVLLPKTATNPYPVKSDTCFPVGIRNGRTYTFAITVNGKVVPAITVGNDKTFTGMLKQTGGKYYYTVTAIGRMGAMTAVYSTLPGQKPVVLCYIAVVK